ncbi:MAG: hypothetical protein QGH39_03975 [Candidatus Thermoplasmatota archaeon]|nr:hypothetical protein [Candidatus Thermoplasmatota archaeon]
MKMGSKIKGTGWGELRNGWSGNRTCRWGVKMLIMTRKTDGKAEGNIARKVERRGG